MARDYTVLSLDLGSTVGWAFVKNATILHSGIVPLSRKDAHPGDRFLRFHNWLLQMKANKVNEIFYESVPRFESAAAAHVYCGLLAVLQMFCLMHGLRMTNIKAKSVKKEFAGNGNADKFEMCRVAHRMGWKNGHAETDIDHDECDAIAIAWVILTRRNAEPALYEAKKAVFEAQI